MTPEPEPYVDPYEAVRTYWSEDQLTQSWGPDQIVEHLFFPSRHRLSPVGFMTAARARANATGLDDWRVTADEVREDLTVRV